MNTKISIAIETSSRKGAVALGRGNQLLATAELGSTGRHAAALLPALDELFKAHSLTPADIDEIYISVGPGSFTGLRVGITAARTLGQMIPDAKIVAVPTELAIAQNVADRDWENLGVILAAKHESVYASLISRDKSGDLAISGEPGVYPLLDAIANFPAGTVLTGEGIGFCETELPADFKQIESDCWYPEVASVWTVGNKLAAEGKFTPYSEVLPVYSRKPEAIRLWEKRNAAKQD